MEETEKIDPFKEIIKQLWDYRLKGIDPQFVLIGHEIFADLYIHHRDFLKKQNKFLEIFNLTIVIDPLRERYLKVLPAWYNASISFRIKNVREEK